MLAITSSIQAQSFTNASFETGLSSHPNYNGSTALNAVPDGWDLFTSTGGFLVDSTSPDWVSSGGDPTLARMVGDGNNTLFLDSVYDSDDVTQLKAGVSQTVSGFSPFETYQVIFDAAILRSIGYDQPPFNQPSLNQAEEDAYIDVYLNDVLYTSVLIDSFVTIDVSTSIADGQSSPFGFTFSAPASSVKLGFQANIPFDNTDGQSHITNIAIDNFSITQVPEPAGGLLIGLAGLLVATRRHRC